VLSGPWGCSGEPGREARFLDRWLAEHAAGLGSADRQRLVTTLLACQTRHDVDALLLLAVIEQESGYDPDARSRRGARGLMQLRPATARDLAGRLGIDGDLDDPAKNVRLGAAYLADLKERFGTWPVALAAYHSGPTRIRRLEWSGRKIPASYASRVLERYERMQAAFSQDGGRADD
jgi:soluble lytic murein transglycosylase-like protein